MAQIRPRRGAARVAAARRVRRTIVFGVARVLDIDAPLAREQLTVPGIAGRQHAVEQVDAARRRFDQILRRAGSHQISRPVVGKKPRRVRDDVVHHIHRLADAQPADGISVEADRDGGARAFFAQLRVDTALHDPELRLPGSSRLPEREKAVASAPRPAQRPAHRLARGVGRGRVREALVEHHRDVGSELCLDVRGFLGRQQMRRTVKMRAEPRAFFVHRPPRREAEHLIAAAVGENRPRPTDEPVQPAAACDEVAAWAQIKMIRVAEQDLGAQRFEVAVGHALHRPLRADRHERRRLHVAVRGRQHAAPRTAVGMRDAETEGHRAKFSLSVASGEKTARRRDLRRPLR